MNSEPFWKKLLKVAALMVVAVSTSIGTLLLLLVIFVVSLLVVVSSLSGEFTSSGSIHETLFGKEDAEKSIVSIPITGVIVGDSTDISDPLGFVSESVTYGYDVKQTLKELSEDESVVGVVLDINSPGGTIYGANAIAEGVDYYQSKTQKPVVAFVSGMAASGGYWVAAASDYIIADWGTSVGSIGVISGPFQYYDTVVSQDSGAFVGGVVTQKGIETTFITAGKSKDLGNPYRRMTQEELTSLQSMVNREYDIFVNFVSKKRSIESAFIRESLGALLYDSGTAVDMKLSNAVGNRESAYEWIAKKTNSSLEDLRVIREHVDGGFLKTLLQSQLRNSASASFCTITSSSLVYHGDVSKLCF